MSKKKVKLTQILDTGKGLFGLTIEGDVVVYQGKHYGWSMLNMSGMSEKDAENKWREQEQVNDDIPF